MFLSSPDSSLTSHSLLAVLDTVENANDISGTDYGELESILEIPDPKWKEMRSKCVGKDNYRSELIQYYLVTHPCAGWNHLAGQLLYYKKYSARAG